MAGVAPVSVGILGVTGSIGTQALDVIRAFPDRFRLVAVSGHTNSLGLAAIANEFRPERVAVGSVDQVAIIRKHMDYDPVIEVGESGLVALATHPMDQLVVAIVGTAALPAVVAAIPHVPHIALANKEVLVAAGSRIMAMVRAHGTRLIPVDSEHSAVFQCLAAVDFNRDRIHHMTLTASGGPFWGRDPHTFDTITPAEALRHPNWDMGSKISVDSATMVNKGLEVIEAHHLFDMAWDRIRVVVHPQSIVHACIETVDGAILAHMGRPDMRYPIQYAMTYPERWATPFKQDGLTALSGLEFFEPDRDAFPWLDLAICCGKAGGVMPIVFNAANEVAVPLFLNGQVSFMGMYDTIRRILDAYAAETVVTIADIIELDKRVKNHVTIRNSLV